MRRNVIICLLLAGITLVLYWPVHSYGLVYYDDPIFLTESPEIQSGLNWHSLRWSFSSVLIANWHPITTLSFVVDHQFFGASPAAEHLVNSVFHAANAVLLFWLLQAMTRSFWRSALVAAVFAWHPLRVESVAWITERKDVLCGFFFLLTLLFYVERCQVPGPRAKFFYAASLMMLALGLMSKAMLVSTPLVLLALDVWPLQRLFSQTVQKTISGRRGSAALPESQRLFSQAEQKTDNATSVSATHGQWRTLKKLLWEKWPFFAVTVLFSALTYVIQKNYAAVVSLDKLGWNYRVANAITNYLRYLAHFFWPADLAVIYPYQRIDDWLPTGLIAVGMVAVSGFCLRQFRRRPWLAVGWFWYVVTSLPIIGLVQVGEAAMADRYTYITLIGPVMALVWTIPEFWPQGTQRFLWGSGLAATLGALLYLTHVQIQYWHDTASLFGHAVAVTGDNPGAESGLGIGLEHDGRVDEALVHYRRAVALNPGERDNYLKAGHVLMLQGQWAEAAADMLTALTMDANDVTAHENLGSILPHLGRSGEAGRHLEAAAKIAPDDPKVLNNLAWFLATSGDPALRDGPRAVKIGEQACQMNHYHQTVFLGTLAAAYAEAGRFDDAIATAQKACDSATAKGETELLGRNQELLALYRKHQPYHEPAP